MAETCCDTDRPSTDAESSPERSFFKCVATRTMKNSSRLDPTMARNFTRSSKGWDSSSAWSSTR